MDLIIYAIILSILPISELRGGLPLGIIYARQNDVPLLLVFLSIILANILVIFLIFFFLDNMHKIFLKKNFYRRFSEKHLEKLRGRMENFEKKHRTTSFAALTFFTALPVPFIGGAWTAVLMSWLLNLDRKKSIAAISLGVLIAGLIVLSVTLGFLGIFS